MTKEETHSRSKLATLYLGVFYCVIAALVVLLTLPICWMIDYRKLARYIKRYTLPLSLALTFGVFIVTAIAQTLGFDSHPRVAALLLLIVGLAYMAYDPHSFWN